MNSLIRKLVKKIGISWLTGQIRAAAEGKLGPRWEALYWGLAGKKRLISILVGCAAATAGVMGNLQLATVLASIAAVGVSLGFVDAHWREQGDADDFKETAWWKFLADNAPVVVTVLLAAFGWAEASCVGAYCDEIRIGLGGVAAVLVQIGILDAAWRAKPPA